MSGLLPVGAAVVASDELAVLLALKRAAIIDAYARDGLVPPQVTAFLDDCGEVAARRRLSRAAASLPIGLSKIAPPACEAGPLLTTEQVKQRLKITTTQGVTDLIHRGRLEGWQDGPGCAWSVSERSVAKYLQEREQTRRRAS